MAEIVDNKVISDLVIILFQAAITVFETIAGAIWDAAGVTMSSLLSNSFGGSFWVILTVLVMVYCTYYIINNYQGG